MANIEKALDDLLLEVKPVLDNLWNQFPPRYKNLAEMCFDNMIDLAKQLASAKVEGDAAKVERTLQSLEHVVNALLSIIVSGIVSLEDPVRQAASTLALRALGTLLTRLFSLVKA